MGDMSLVGPRPPLPDEVTKYEDWHFDRLEAPPGITGLWQISGRSELSFDDCVRLDLFYIENWSLAYDAYILMKTIPVLLRHRGAY
jgi:lipopolysaccharide/colanic/teichoic acid biosynthesis glycosyltransferase